MPMIVILVVVTVGFHKCVDEQIDQQLGKLPALIEQICPSGNHLFPGFERRCAGRGWRAQHQETRN